MKFHQFLFISIAFFAAGCGEEDRSVDQLANLTQFDLQSAAPIELIKDEGFSIGSYETVNNIGDVAVDSLGKVYVVNLNRNRIEAFDNNGNFMTSIGRAGGDPGEFQNPGMIKVVGDRLYAYDKNMYRGYSFSLNDFEIEHSILLDMAASLNVDTLKQAKPNYIEVMADGSFLAAYQIVDAPDVRHLFFYRINASGMFISDQIMTAKSKNLYVDDTMTNTVIMMLPYERETLVATDSRKNIYTAFTEDFLIKVADSTGTYVEAFHYPFEKHRLQRSDAIDMFTNVNERRAIRGATLPATWPALAEMLIDDKDRLWAATITKDLNSYRWYVFEKSGKPVGTFTLPRKQEIMVIKDDQVYVKTYNRQLYSEVVLRYKAQFPTIH